MINLQDQHIALMNLYQSNNIDRDVYCKMTLQLAYQYIQQNAVNEAVALLTLLPSDYFQVILLEQCQSDEDFAQQAYTIAKVLHNSHKVLSNREASDVMYNAMVSANKIGKA